jgi:hypothetical protein
MAKTSQNATVQGAESGLTRVFHLDDQGVCAHIKGYVGLAERCALVDSVVRAVIGSGDDGVEYMPELERLFMFVGVCRHFTDLDVDNIDIETFDRWMCLGVAQEVYDTIGDQVVSEIRDAIRTQVEFQKRMVFDLQKEKLNTVINDLKTSMSMLTSFAEQFDNVDLGRLVSVASLIANKSEEDLAKAILKEQTTRE